MGAASAVGTGVRRWDGVLGLRTSGGILARFRLAALPGWQMGREILGLQDERWERTDQAGGTAVRAGAAERRGTAARILVVEDDQPLGRFLLRTLRSAAHEAEVVHDGTSALRRILGVGENDEAGEREKTEESGMGNAWAGVNLVILDINLPGMDGFEVLRRLRPEQPKLPVLVLTARSRTEDTVRAFESGADDCLLKPFSYVELLARVGALLRRNTGVVARVSQVADLTLSREEHRVERGGRRVELTPREFGLLEYLMREPGTPVSRAVLMQEVWGTEFDPSTNVVDVYMKYLRDKIDRADEVKLIRTVRGVGYVVGAE